MTHEAGSTIHLIYRPSTWSPSQVVARKIAKVTPKGYRLDDGTLLNQEFRGGPYKGPATPDDVKADELQQRKRKLWGHVHPLGRRIEQRRLTEEQVERLESLVAQIDEVLT